jgi:hypothetical protein
MELKQNPFYILQATPRDDRWQLAKLAEDASLSADPDACQKARSELINPRKRLDAEISWFPGIDPATVKALVARLDSDASTLRELKELKEYSGLVRFNLLSTGLSRLQESRSAFLVKWVLDIALSFDDINIDTVCKEINKERSASGFPELTDRSWVENELNEKKSTGKKIINQALNRLKHDDRIVALTFIIESATNKGNTHAPVMIHDLIDDYELESQTELEKGEAAISVLVENIKNYARQKGSGERLAPMTEELLSALTSWDKAAQPIQISKKSLGLNHNASKRVAIMVRGLALQLYNEHNKLDIAQRITTNLQILFSELLDIAELTGEDAKTLKNLEANWKRERLYDGLVKISKAPSMRNINGFGFMLYGSTNHDPENGSFLATYYFVALFIPIFPICRYRVIRNGKSYSFLGKAPLREIDKWHLGIALAIIAFLGINSMLVSSRSASRYDASAGRTATTRVATSASEKSADDATAYPTSSTSQQNTDNTSVDTALINEIEQEKSELQSMESSLTRLKADIESNKKLLRNYDAGGNYDAYNELVPTYNSLVEEFRSKAKKYNDLADEVNAKISRYSARERR